MRWILAVGLFLTLFSCQKKLSKEDLKTVRLNIHTEPPSLDTRKATDTCSIGVISMCFEGLMKRKSDGKIAPALAHKIEVSKDKKTYTFYLREAKWSDGAPVTAHDFETTWKTILDPLFPSGFANDLFVIKNAKEAKNGIVSLERVGVKALDSQTLLVELEHPIPYFLDLTASHSFLPVPSHIVLNYPRWADNCGPHFVGNGPFLLKSWKHHNCIILEKNPSYWQHEVVNIGKIYMSMIEDPSTELNMFEAGELEWAGYPLSALPTDALQPLATTKKLLTCPLAGTYYYVFNVTAPPFDNLNLRKAFSLAINRGLITENIIHYEQPATGIVPPSIWKAAPYFDDNDVKEARRLFNIAMKEMGVTYETFPQITLTYNTCEAHHKIAQAIQEQWFRAFGIRVKLGNKEWKVFLDELTHKQFQIARLGGIAGFNDPVTFLDIWRYPHNPNNYSGWTHPEYTRLLCEAESTTDIHDRELLLREAEALMISEMPIAPIYFYKGNYLKKTGLKGVELSELNDLDFKFAFLENQ